LDLIDPSLRPLLSNNLHILSFTGMYLAWIYVPDPDEGVVNIVHALSVVLKHHLLRVREWEDPELDVYRRLLDRIEDVCLPSPDTE